MNETYVLLRSYAATRYTLTVAGTVVELISWYEGYAGTRISERTFKRHTAQLRAAGLVEVRHTKSRTYYTLVGFEFEMPRVKFLPAADPGLFLIENDGADTVRHGESAYDAAVEREHHRAMASLEDFDLDALQVSWPAGYAL